MKGDTDRKGISCRSNDGTADFTYTTTSQLTAVSGWRSESYTLDALGNRTNSGYWTGTGNRLASDGTFNYSYDNEGNLLTKTEIATSKVTEYTWDYRNRLTNVKVKSSGGAVLQETNYTVDPVDNRIGVSFDSDGAGSQPAVQTWTSYDGQNPYADFNGSGSLTTRYLYGNGVDQLFGRTTASGTAAWYLTDHLGSVRDIANTSGSVIDHIKYDSFGKVISESSPSNGDRFKYTGRELDQNGLYYYRARYYDAAVGRFLAEDPLRFQAGDANFYRYVGNHPTFATDPTGRAEQPQMNSGGGPLGYTGGAMGSVPTSLSSKDEPMRPTIPTTEMLLEALQQERTRAHIAFHVRELAGLIADYTKIMATLYYYKYMALFWLESARDYGRRQKACIDAGNKAGNTDEGRRYREQMGREIQRLSKLLNEALAEAGKWSNLAVEYEKKYENLIYILPLRIKVAMDDLQDAMSRSAKEGDEG